jgi:hypothetical protein
MKITDKEGKEVELWCDYEQWQLETKWLQFLENGGSFATEEQREAWWNATNPSRP